MDRHIPDTQKKEFEIKLKKDFRNFQNFSDVLETPGADVSGATSFFEEYQKDPDCLITICNIMLKSIRPAAIKIAAIVLLKILKQKNVNHGRLFDLLDSISQRANSSIIELDEFTQGKLIQCIATICSIDIHFIENGRRLTSSNTISYLMYLFEILFEGYSKNYFEIKKYLINYGPNFIALLYNNLITKDWLTLFSYVIQITEDLNLFYRLTPKLESITHCSELYPYMISVLESAQCTTTIHNLVKCSVFVEKLIDIMLDIVSTLLSDDVTEENINMAVGIWEIIFGFDAEFYAQDSIVGLMRKIVEFCSYTIEIIINDKKSLDIILEDSTKLFGVLISQENTIHQTTFTPFLDFLLKFANDPSNQRESLSHAFKNITFYMGSVVEKYFLQFETSEVLTEGIVFSIASSSKFLRKKICPLILNRVTTEGTLPYCTPLFTCKCVHNIPLSNYPELYNNVCAGVSSCDEISCEAFRRITEYNMIYYAKNVEIPFELALNGIASGGPLSSANLYCAAVYLMQGCHLLKKDVEEMIGAIEEVGNTSLERIAGEFGVKGVSIFLHRLFKKIFIDYLPTNSVKAVKSILFNAMEGLNNNWIHAGEGENSSDQELLCEVLRSALKRGWIEDKGYVASHIFDAICADPIPAHFVLLEDVIDILPYSAIFEKIKDFETFEDPKVQSAALTFVMFLVMSNIQMFIEHFGFEFPLSILSSELPGNVAIGLNILSVCLERSPDTVGLARASLGGVCSAVFQTGDNGVFELCYRMLIKIANILGGPQEVVDFIHENAPNETEEFNMFAEHFIDSPDATAKLLLKELSEAYRE